MRHDEASMFALVTIFDRQVATYITKLELKQHVSRRMQYQY